MSEKIKEREERLGGFLSEIFNDYGVEFEIKLNDDPEPQDYTVFEVFILNNTGSRKVCPVVRVWDYDGGFEKLIGEDFMATNHEDFVMQLFLDVFSDTGN